MYKAVCYVYNRNLPIIFNIAPSHLQSLNLTMNCLDWAMVLKCVALNMLAMFNFKLLSSSLAEMQFETK